MNDQLIDDTDELEDDAPLTPGRRFAAGAVALVVVVAVVFVMVRVSSPPIPPKQAEPDPHWGEQCAWCHVVSETAKPIEVEK